ncbi:MAG: NUDIX hydrolase [Deinococcus sp.]|nr:NUDIX hydrolase [Deinococcus sp.]
MFVEKEPTHCPHCSGTLESRIVTVGDRERLVCSQCGFVFYLGPKLAAGTLPTIDGRVVLARRAVEPGYGKWTYPGGYVERFETVPDAAKRETGEEVNLDVALEGILGVYSYPTSLIVVVVYLARAVGGQFSAGHETLEVCSFAPSEIPWEELAFSSTRDAILDWARHYGVTLNRR